MISYNDIVTAFKKNFIKKPISKRIILFIHIPKTAGTLLRQQYFLKNIKILENLYWYDNNKMSKKEVFEKYGKYEEALSLDMIGGHLTIAEFLKLEIIQSRVFTAVIREPVSQVLSHYNFILNINKNHPTRQYFLGKTLFENMTSVKKFDELINNQIYFLFQNGATINSNDQFIIGKQEYLPEYIKSLNQEFYIGELDYGKKENVGGSYMQKLEQEDNYDQAIKLLRKKLSTEIVFYNSFSRVLKMDSDMYAQYNDSMTKES